MKIKTKIFLKLIFGLLFLLNFNFVLAQKYTVHSGPSELKEEVQNQGTYHYIERREKLEPGIFENIEVDIQDKEVFENEGVLGNNNFKYLNYKNWHFWVLFGILFLIIVVFIRFLINLSKINKEIKRHENYLREIKLKKRLVITDEDEIIYSDLNDE